MLSIETYNPPQVGQLLNIRNLGIAIACRQQKIRQMRNDPNDFAFLPRGVENVSEVNEQGEPISLTFERFLGRVRQVDLRGCRWRMLIIENSWSGNLWLGKYDTARTVYSFEWNPAAVFKACQTVQTYNCRNIARELTLPAGEQDCADLFGAMVRFDEASSSTANDKDSVFKQFFKAHPL